MRKPAPETARPTNAYACALRRLALRDHSERELVNALSRKGFAEDDIAPVVHRLRREHLIDDARFARRHAASRIGSRGMGRNRVRSELHRRGVPRETVEAGLREALIDVSESAALDAVARRYWQAHARVARLVRYRRLFALLLRRGFAPALVTERLRALSPEWRLLQDDLGNSFDDATDFPDATPPGTTRED